LTFSRATVISTVSWMSLSNGSPCKGQALIGSYLTSEVLLILPHSTTTVSLILNITEDFCSLAATPNVKYPTSYYSHVQIPTSANVNVSSHILCFPWAYARDECFANVLAFHGWRSIVQYVVHGS
jgi:hypothetical protein